MDFNRIIFLDGNSILSNSLNSFDCGNDDLNEFIKKDALKYEESLLAKTYLIIDVSTEKLIAFYSVLNDKVSMDHTISKNAFNKQIKSELTHYKNHLKEIPSVKIGRLAVDSKFARRGYGKSIIDFIKSDFSHERNKTGCHFITVDSYKKSKAFYEKQGFEKYPVSLKDDKETILMYYNLLEYKKKKSDNNYNYKK